MSKLPKEPYKKLYLLITPIVGVALAIYLIISFFTGQRRANTNPANLTFTKETGQAPANSKFKLNLDPGGNKISFLRIRVHFNKNLVQLTGDIDTTNSLLSNEILVTSTDEANNKGNIEIVLAKEPGLPSPTSPFEVASLEFIPVGSEDSEVTIVDEDTQLIADDSSSVPFDADFATVTVNKKQQ